MKHSDADNEVGMAITTLAAGGMILVTDADNRENEADLVVAAELITDAQMAFMVRHTTGIICAPMTESRAEELDLAPMVAASTDQHGTAFTVSVDLVGTGTGVSACDRAATVRGLADRATTPGDLRRPGHVFPLRARPGGVLERPGHTEAAVDLLDLAGLGETGVIGEVLAEDGAMRRGRDLTEFAAEHLLPVVSIAALIRHRWTRTRLVEPGATADMPTKFGRFRAVAYRNTVDGTEHLALVYGDPAASADPRGALVRVHSECLTGDILGSLRCDCGEQLQASLGAIAAEGCGAVIYLRGHEGRGIGLAPKIRAYELQDQGLDTVDANIAQGLPVDARTYGVAAQILADLGIGRLRLITNNPAEFDALGGYGLEVVERVALATTSNSDNIRYLRSKRDRLDHRLDSVLGL